MTREEFFKILPLYIGQQVQYFDFFTNKYEVGTLRSAGDDGYFFVQGDNNGQSTQYARLLLRPLSTITEAEEAKWNKISTTVGEMHPESALQIHWAKRINYYRSIGIDCDGLLDTQWAIDKTKFNQ